MSTMSLLARFEAFMEQVVETSAARFFKSPLDAATLTRRLERAMEANQVIDATGITIVPNIYQIFLHPIDFANHHEHHLQIERELANYLTDLARNRGFTTHKSITVLLLLASNISVSRNVVRIDCHVSLPHSQHTGGESAANVNPLALNIDRSTIVNTQFDRYPINYQYALIVETTPPDKQKPPNAQIVETEKPIIHTLPMTQTLTTIGRAPGNSVLLDDSSVSRYHAKISYNAKHFAITDLASRNGTFVNGTQLTKVPHIIAIKKDTITISIYTLYIQEVNKQNYE